MTVLNPEVKPSEQQQQAAIHGDLSQSKPEANLPQKKIEVPQQSNQEVKEPEGQEDPNWRAFREARKKDRADREAAERRAAEKEQEVAALKAAMEAAFTNRGPTPQAYQQQYGLNQGYDQPEESEEQRIERKVNDLLSKREEQYKKQQQEEEQRTYPQRLMKDFPDFNQVCSQENLDYLDYHFSEVSAPLQGLNDGYDKWRKTYNAVKRFIPNHSTAKREAVRAEINSNKPRSISSSGPSPTGQAMTTSYQDVEARRAENWARMQRTLKGV